MFNLMNIFCCLVVNFCLNDLENGLKDFCLFIIYVIFVFFFIYLFFLIKKKIYLYFYKSVNKENEIKYIW